MPLFQSTILQKYTNALDTPTVDASYERFSAHFLNPVIQENIRLAKEEQYQGEFLIDLFVKVLGYVKNPTPNFNLTTEFKNIKDSKKADGAIIKNEMALGVIELKGTAVTDLGRIEVQAFGYKNNQPGCVYVITSNFEKLRFYIDNAVDFEEFNLFQLSRERFNVLWLCLSAEQLLAGKPKQLKEESLSQEEQITKQLYKDYSLFRNEVFQNIVDNNPQYDKLTLFKQTQKLLDRFLFIFFAEDRLLLPPNSILAIVQQWKDLRDKYDAYTQLYDRFKKYFGYLNTGHKGQKHDIFAYNGGLFTPDPILDDLTIDDDLLYKHTVKLTHYDFESEVSVNILGHIFEHSLNEIEEIQAELEGQVVDKSSSKRKKDGVFYTPKYITKYIVDNTVGKLCEEQKTTLDIQEAEYDKGRKNRPVKVVKALKQKLDDYRAWLLQLTICDPACGSGAFLNQALEFLIAEHAYVDELQAKLFGDALVLSDVENSILEHNLYGVDINNESVEIAKLSLWLRTAQKGRKLTTLNNNIKCGNSLIDDPAVAGDKAFDWEKEFPQVFAKGGFDVVIGNPPYVRVQFLEHYQIDWFKKNKKVAHKRIDISLMFFELSSEILKNNGIVSFITSNQFLTTEYGRNCRKLLLEDFKIEHIIDFGDLPVFEGALTYVSIFTLRNSKPQNFKVYNVDTIKKAEELDLDKPINIKIENLTDDSWVLKDSKEKEILEKLKRHPILKKVGNCNYGIITGNDSIFILDENDLKTLSIEKEILLPLLRAENCGRYKKVNATNFILYPYKEIENDTVLYSEEEIKKKFPIAYGYLEGNKITLEKRKDSRKTLEGAEDWYKLTRFGTIALFNKIKIVYPGETKNNKFGIDYNKSGYSGARVFSITLNDNNEKNLLALLAILNSKLVEFYLHSNSPLKQGGYYSYSSTILNTIPIPKAFNSYDLDIKSSNIIVQYDSFDSIVLQFANYLSHQFNEIILTRKLENWQELDFTEFIKELNKVIKKAGASPLTKKDEFEWLELFEENKKKAQVLQNEINRLDKEIDGMVYGLYGLSEEEVAIVENS